MKHFILIMAGCLALLKGCEVCPAAEVKAKMEDSRWKIEVRFEALSQIESGDNDFAVGAAGERGRYQMSEKVWREMMPPDCWKNFSGMTNANFALAAAQGVMACRIVQFKDTQHREPTDAEWYLLYHRPARVLNPRPIERERAQRFANLCGALNRRDAKAQRK